MPEGPIADTFNDHEADADTAAPEWAVVEIMGHRQHAGQILEVTRFGATLIEIREYGTGDDKPYRVHQYGGPAIFSITPCTAEYARKTCDERWRWSRQNGDTVPLLEWEDTNERWSDA